MVSNLGADLYAVEFDYTIFAPYIEMGYNLIQSFRFVPKIVETAIDIAGTVKSGILGDNFAFTAPTDATNELSGTATYDLEGDVEVSYSLVPAGKVGADLLAANAILHYAGNQDPFSFGPVGHVEYSQTADFGIIDLFSGTVAVPDHFLTPISLPFTLQVAPLEDGPNINSSDRLVDASAQPLGVVNLEAPSFMMDGDVDYTVTISGSGAAAQYNVAYIIDVSGSMSGQNIVDARNAYIELTNQLKKLGIADVANFAVIPFNGSSTLYSDLSADQAISRISALNAGGSTYFGPPISDAQSFFSGSKDGQSNIAYFLSDGRGSGASTSLSQIANVQAFGIGSGADLRSLNIIDSDNAVSLSSSSQLVDVLTSSSVNSNEIDRVEITLDGVLVETISASQLSDGPLGLQYKGSVSGLDVSAGATNKLEATVYLKDGTLSGDTDLSIASALENDTSVTPNGNGMLTSHLVPPTAHLMLMRAVMALSTSLPTIKTMLSKL